MASICVLGAGWYGLHLASALIKDGHDVEVHEKSNRIFSGASGGIPARVHTGQHYPRSGLTRSACQQHHSEFMAAYGHVTSSVPVNIYAIAKDESLVDFATYQKVLKGEIEYITIDYPEEYGLANVEGAILTGERHVVIRKAIEHFESTLQDHIILNSEGGGEFDRIIDCTFCANDAANIDRYEPCLTVILEGPTSVACTVMDGPFPSLYPWDEEKGLCSLTSAKYTPFRKDCESWGEAKDYLESLKSWEIDEQAEKMSWQMAHYLPDFHQHYHIKDYKLSVRAMPKSGSDARLVDVVKTDDKTLRIRAGKIDAVLHAERLVKSLL